MISGILIARVREHQIINTLKTFILSLLLGTIICLPAFSQIKQNAIKASPLGLIIGFGKVSYERALNESNSAQLAFSFFSYDLSGTSFSGIGFVPEYRFYLSDEKEAIEGFYAAPFVVYNNFTIKSDEENSKASLNIFGGGGKVGWNWLLGKSDAFNIDLSLGMRYTDANLSVKSGTEDDFDFDLWKGFRPDIRFALGFAF